MANTFANFAGRTAAPNTVCTQRQNGTYHKAIKTHINDIIDLSTERRYIVLSFCMPEFLMFARLISIIF